MWSTFSSKLVSEPVLNGSIDTIRSSLSASNDWKIMLQEVWPHQVREAIRIGGKARWLKMLRFAMIILIFIYLPSCLSDAVTEVISKSSSKVEWTRTPYSCSYAQCGLDRTAQWHRWMKIQPAVYEVTPASSVWRRWMKHTSKNKAHMYVLPY